MAVSYASFGVDSPTLYAAYLYACVHGSSADILADGKGVSHVAEGRLGIWRDEVSNFVDGVRVACQQGVCDSDSRRDWADIGLQRRAVSGGVVPVGTGISGKCSDGAGESDVRDGSVLGSSSIAGSKLDEVSDIGLAEGHNRGVLGKNTERNRQWRKEKKERKHRKQCQQGKSKLWTKSEPKVDVTFENFELQKEQSELKRSSAVKWKMQNELATERARRELHVLQQSDIQSEVQRYRTKISAATERNMVSIEKTHGLLKSTGNVPGFHGSVETVVDGEIVSSNTPELVSGSISPNSSISQAEARKAQKDLLDSQNEVVKLKEKLALITRKAGFSAEHFELYDKNTWTENDENEALLDELYPEGYVVNREYCAAGKFQLR